MDAITNTPGIPAKKAEASRLFSLERIIGSIALCMSLFHLYCAYFGQPEALIFRTTFLGFILVLCFLTRPLGGKLWDGRHIARSLLNIVLVFLPLLIQWYILRDIRGWYMRFGNPTPTDVILGTIYILMVLDATRRAIGWPIVIVAIFFLLNARFADKMQLGFFYGPPMPWKTLVNFIWMEESGIFGVPISVMASVITLFLIFASILQKSGIVNILLDLAFSIAGHKVGGPAKAAVVGSALMGTVSGSSVANVATTGSVTIPLMKKVGYRPYFAGAVEAAASTAGQITPPVMGAAAFIMAQFLGVPYIKIAVYAIVPAVLYYVAIFLAIHYQSLNRGIKPIPKSKLPDFWAVLKKGGHMLIPLIVLLVVMGKGYSVQMAVIWSIILTLIMSFLKPETRLTPQTLLSSLEEGSRSFVSVALACATAGIIVGAIDVSGLGWRISSSLLDLSGQSLWLTLFLSMIICIVLGMGMTTTAVYLVVAAIVVPNLRNLGVPAMAAHLFAFYFGSMSNITPPVAVASFAAAGIAEANVNRTGIEAFVIALPGFIIPFMFAIYPEMLLTYGSWPETIAVIVVSAISTACLTAGLKGWFMRKLNVIERLVIGVLPITGMFLVDVRTPLYAVIYVAAIAVIALMQKRTPYSSKIDERFGIKTKQPSQVDSNIDEVLEDVMYGDASTEPESGCSSKKNLLTGWGVWAVMLALLLIAGRTYMMQKHFNLFLVLLFAASCTVRRLLEKYA